MLTGINADRLGAVEEHVRSLRPIGDTSLYDKLEEIWPAARLSDGNIAVDAEEGLGENRNNDNVLSWRTAECHQILPLTHFRLKPDFRVC